MLKFKLSIEKMCFAGNRMNAEGDAHLESAPGNESYSCIEGRGSGHFVNMLTCKRAARTLKLLTCRVMLC